ncbi:MAG TPA: hypothetical protein VGH42_04160 [Verrucomicrobiae bacterium]
MNHEKDGIHFVRKMNRATSVICKNVAMNYFVQRLNLDRGGFRQNGAMNVDRSRAVDLRRQGRRGHFVYVIHHNAGNFGKMTNGKWKQKGIRRLCKDCAKGGGLSDKIAA